MVSARREGDTVIVFIPGWMSESEETRWVDEMVRRLERSEARRRSPARTGDDALRRRSVELARRYLEGRAEPTTVRWVPTMSTRWASCTPADGTIRVSAQPSDPSGVATMFDSFASSAGEAFHGFGGRHNTLDQLEPGHDKAFWAWVRRYPRTERAMGYLEGLSAAAGLGLVGTDGDVDEQTSGASVG